MSAFSGQKEYCEGFKDGYISRKGELAIVPTCPKASVIGLIIDRSRIKLAVGGKLARTILNHDYKEGLIDGIMAADSEY
jgi:hypothetical protein